METALNDAVPGAAASTETKGRVLVLDDEIELRAMLSRYLSGQGYTVRAVADAVLRVITEGGTADNWVAYAEGKEPWPYQWASIRPPAR